MVARAEVLVLAVVGGPVAAVTVEFMVAEGPARRRGGGGKGGAATSTVATAAVTATVAVWRWHRGCGGVGDGSIGGGGIGGGGIGGGGNGASKKTRGGSNAARGAHAEAARAAGSGTARVYRREAYSVPRG